MLVTEKSNYVSRKVTLTREIEDALSLIASSQEMSVDDWMSKVITARVKKIYKADGRILDGKC